MVINFVLPSLGASGGIDVVYKYVELLIKHGHDVRVYKELKARNMYRYSSSIKNWAHQMYCTIKAVVLKNGNRHDEDCFVWHITDDTVRRADVVIATAWPTAFAVNELSSTAGNKYYFIQDYEIWDNEAMVKKSYMLPLKKIVISTWINNCLKRDLGIGPFPVVYNGIDTKLYHKVEVNRNSQEISFLMLNHLLSKKGVDKGIKAFELVKKKYPMSKLRMFGLCDGGNLPEYVEYYQNPSKEKIVNLYSMSDIFIFPSLEEGWGLTPLEAMACGCVVVGTNVGFALDIGKNKENVMLSSPGDIEGMVENIIELIENPTLRNHISELARKSISDLDWENSCSKMEKCISTYV